jgi:hypothetical protein
MIAILYALGTFVADLFKSRSRLEAENLFLRYQLNLALRQKPFRIRLRDSDRALLVWMVRLWPGLLDAVRNKGTLLLPKLLPQCVSTMKFVSGPVSELMP